MANRPGLGPALDAQPAADPSGPAPLDGAKAGTLAVELRQKIRGEVRFDEGTRALYATDLSAYRQVPIGVVIPRDERDVIDTVAICRARDVPVLPRGCGTSLAGQTCNVAVVLDFSKYMNTILELDPESASAWVEPGVICDQLRDAAEEHGLTFAPDPATHAYCTLGGMIGNNSCGAHSVMGGKTVDNVEELEILTYEGDRMRVGPADEATIGRIVEAGGPKGEVYARLRELRDRHADEIRRRFVDIPRRVSGYNLDDLLPEKGFHAARALVGSEGTCAVVLKAKVRLMKSPPKRALLVVGYQDIAYAGDHAAEFLAHGPLAVEAFHDRLIANLARRGKGPAAAAELPEGGAWLLVEFGGETQEEANRKARQVRSQVEGSDRDQKGVRVFEDAEAQQAVWKIRESGVGASRIPGEENGWPGWEDAAVPPARVGEYLRELTALMNEFGYAHTMYGHIGQGCVHVRINFDFNTVEGVRRYRDFQYRASDIVLRFGGSHSGEHGDGQARGELLPRMFGDQLMQAFREFKSIWDPRGRMNPGKVVDAYPLDRNLRVGPDYAPRRVQTHFRFPEDGGSYAAAVERCFGVGKCRGLSGGTMCPSFMATREERHTTRGRAHLLFEMMRGEVVTGGWKDEHVRESLHLCLSCKGCKGDCPVSVDLATYKAEFMSHYYERRLRPRHAYALGLVYRWARLGSRVPRIANFIARGRGVSRLAKSIAGLTQERAIPPIADESFQSWFHSRPLARRGNRRVILWPDTFNNYFTPRIARAAAAVLADAGCDVVVPKKRLCCGRPLYDFGMLDRARAELVNVLTVLREEIRAGTPVVGLEPSCVSVFRDELTNLFPHDLDAKRLRAQTLLLGEFLQQDCNYGPPRLEGRAIVHEHCHHKAVLGREADLEVLRRMGLEVRQLESGCCGVAGSFGYEPEKYELSMKIGERVLLPAVAEAPKDALIIANGFSCRSQIEHGTDRSALHLAEVLRLAGSKPGEALRPYPERG